jgi:hypothetical protein
MEPSLPESPCAAREAHGELTTFRLVLPVSTLAVQVTHAPLMCKAFACAPEWHTAKIRIRNVLRGLLYTVKYCHVAAAFPWALFTTHGKGSCRRALEIMQVAIFSSSTRQIGSFR